MFTFGITFYKNGEKTKFVSGRQQRILQEKSTSEQDNDEELSLRLQDCKGFVKEEPDHFNKDRKTFCSYQKFVTVRQNFILFTIIEYGKCKTFLI